MRGHWPYTIAAGLGFLALAGCAAVGSGGIFSGASKGDNSCTAAVAAELDAKKFLSKLYRSEYWGECVRVQAFFLTATSDSSNNEYPLFFTAYRAPDAIMDQFMFRAPSTHRDTLFNLKRGGRITVVGRVQKSGSVVVGDWILVDQVAKGD